MSALEVTKSTAGGVMRTLGFSPSASAAAASAVGGIAASVAAQLVWTPVDVISQRLMVQGSVSERQASAYACSKHGHMSPTYKGGLDAFRCIVRTDGWRGLYRGFGLSIVTYAPSSALWWASYSLTQRIVWGSLGYRQDVAGECPLSMPSSSLVVGVQGLSAACAGGAAALVTTPLDTIKTRLQVENDQLTTRETVLRLVKEGGWRACYRGLGPRWAMMAMSAVTMITTYEFLKRSSKKSF
ncbi:hypothetical protein KP509_21G046700 [Ceratopteris richardii]|uniref:Mitochondrial carrier protein n=1 Tax=Ceratopteris richardii TaxID=49495 RepID=A0A8T2SD59_CERRI|nr:hypothetical protein KP509_21G046700 [Ceratopteris richardii]